MTVRVASESASAAAPRSTPNELAISSTVGVRPSAEVSDSWTASDSLILRRAVRVAQSAARISSAIAPRMRRRAKAPKGTPRAGSKLSAAMIRPRAPAEARSSRER